jgi:hypothetical protein
MVIMYHASCIMDRGMGRWLSGQRQQTVNLPARAYAGSNPALPTNHDTRCRMHDTGCKMRDTNYYTNHASCIMNHASSYACAGVAQLARASAFQAEGRGFESRLPLKNQGAHVAQSAEHILGKDEVSGSSPLVGSSITIQDARYRIQDTECKIYLGLSITNHASWISYRAEFGGKDNV